MVIVMRISKCKKELARIISEHGGWRDGYGFSAQDGDDCAVWFYDNAPVRGSGAWWVTSGSGLDHCGIKDVAKLPNWHQTVLSRAEYFHLYPEHTETEYKDGVKPTDPAKADDPSKPTIEQLAADYRNKLDYANRKQDEADKANMESDAALAQLEDAIAEIGFAITPLAETEKEPELSITNWRDLRVGDVIELTGSSNPCWKEHAGIEMTVKEVHYDQGAGDDQVGLFGESGCWYLGGNTTWRFIRRP